MLTAKDHRQAMDLLAAVDAFTAKHGKGRYRVDMASRPEVGVEAWREFGRIMRSLGWEPSVKGTVLELVQVRSWLDPPMPGR